MRKKDRIFKCFTIKNKVQQRIFSKENANKLKYRYKSNTNVDPLKIQTLLYTNYYSSSTFILCFEKSKQIYLLPRNTSE